MQGDDWKKSFYKGDHKQDLLKLVRVFFKSGKRKWHLQRHLVTNSRDRTWKITRKNTEPLPKCNHEQQPDNRMIYHMAEVYTNVVHDVVDKICFTTSSTKNDVSNITFACLTKP